MYKCTVPQKNWYPSVGLFLKYQHRHGICEISFLPFQHVCLFTITCTNMLFRYTCTRMIICRDVFFGRSCFSMNCPLQLFMHTGSKTVCGPNNKIIASEKKMYKKLIDRFDKMYSLALFGSIVF